MPTAQRGSQAERMRISAGKPAGWQPTDGGVLKGAHAKVMMWDDSALEVLPPPPEGNARGQYTSPH